jgi:hypothetical protein
MDLAYVLRGELPTDALEDVLRLARRSQLDAARLAERFELDGAP